VKIDSIIVNPLLVL